MNIDLAIFGFICWFIVGVSNFIRNKKNKGMYVDKIEYTLMWFCLLLSILTRIIEDFDM